MIVHAIQYNMKTRNHGEQPNTGKVRVIHRTIFGKWEGWFQGRERRIEEKRERKGKTISTCTNGQETGNFSLFTSDCCVLYIRWSLFCEMVCLSNADMLDKLGLCACTLALLVLAFSRNTVDTQKPMANVFCDVS